MRNGARVAMNGFTPLYACEKADLVIKMIYDDTLDSINLSVTDADSGEAVFREVRTVSDLGSDVTRMAQHFQSMRSDALAIRDAAIEAAQAAAKRRMFFANLPKHWQCVKGCGEKESHSAGPVIDVKVSQGVLHEEFTSAGDADSVKHQTICSVNEGTDEVTPWTGVCTHSFSWPNWSRPTCTVQTDEIITKVSPKEIDGRSEGIDYNPLHLTPFRLSDHSFRNPRFYFDPSRRGRRVKVIRRADL